MKALFVFILVGMILALGIGFLLKVDPGLVYIRFDQYVVETNVLVFVTLLVLSIGVLYLSIALIRKALGLAPKAKRWFGERSERLAAQKTNEGLIAFLEGNWGEASKLLKSSAVHASTPIVNYLAAAHAANEHGSHKEAQELLKKAYSHTKDSEFAIGIAKAQLELDQNQLESCLATLIRLKAQKPHHPFVLKLLRMVYTRLEDWRQLLQIIPELRKLPGADQERLKALEHEAWYKVFVQRAEELERQPRNEESPAEILAELWKQLPDHLRFNPEIIGSYARQLRRLNCHTEAEALIRKMLSKDWDDQLVEQYGYVLSSDPGEQLIHAENWLKSRPNNASLLLTLGRISMRKELWGKAHEYLIASIRLKPSKEAYAELCRLEASMNDKVAPEHLQGLLNSLSLPATQLPKVL